MAHRHFPVHPNLRQLRIQAKDLLRAIRRGDPAAIADLREHHPEQPAPEHVRLADAQLALARSYQLPSWPRLVLACRMTDAICYDDLDTVRALVLKHPNLLEEDARGVKGNWGPPMSYAANLGRDRIIAMLHELGATDVQFAFERACLQGEVETARRLVKMGARAMPGSVMGPCETLSPDGLAFQLELGAELVDEHGDRLAPIGLVLETYCRNRDGKHACLELLARHRVAFPDTPPMALHRGRIDLLARHLQRDPELLKRRFMHQEIYPPSLGCHTDEAFALGGTPLKGCTLLHMCVDFDEMSIARWLIERGADVNRPATVDADGFGGYTALFACVVVQPGELRESDRFARLLLDHGADPNVRASLRKELRGVDDETLHEYREVTALGWGRRFHDRSFVSEPSLRLIEERGGRE